MEDFWKSVQTIQAERGADYRAFSLFSATHWAELLGAAAVIFLCAVIYYRCREVTRHQILRAVFVLMLADEFMKQAVLLYTGQWNVTYLPLHLCSINIFVCWYDAIHQSRWSKDPKNYFEEIVIPKKKIETLTPKEVAYLMGMGVSTIEKGLIQGTFPWGYAIRTSENKHRYFINAKKFFATEMISV